MSIELITPESLFKGSGFKMWYEIFGHIIKHQGEDYYTNYLLFEQPGEQNQFRVSLKKEQIASLAKLELSEISTEAGFKSLDELCRDITNKPGFDLETNYLLEYPWKNPKTKEVFWKQVSIPVRAINEFSKTNNPDFGSYSVR